MERACGFTRTERIKKKKEFTRVYNDGKRYSNGQINLYFKTTQQDDPGGTQTKIGIVASRKVGNAPERNYLKRVIREVFRTKKNSFKQTVQLVVVLKPAARSVTGEDLGRGFLELCRKARLISI